jgi:uncharacterized protein (TIGR00297 family)
LKFVLSQARRKNKDAPNLGHPFGAGYDKAMKLVWQSKLVMLVVMPFAAASIVLETHWWAVNAPQVAVWTVGLSLLCALVAWKTQSATPAAAIVGAAITASLMFSTATVPYEPWRTALVPVLTLLLLTSLATRMGRGGPDRGGPDRGGMDRLETEEMRQGRTASQVAANLGIAALVSDGLAQSWLIDKPWFSRATLAPTLLFAIGLAALAEAAADTVSSEVGQVLGGSPRMITTLRTVEPGADGAVSLIGTLAGVVAAAIVSLAGALALSGGFTMFWIAAAGGVFGFFFDSLLGATLERRGWLNNDAVNFLSTASAAAFALGLLTLLSH